MSRATILALSLVAALSSGAMAQGVAPAAAVVEQAVRAAHPAETTGNSSGSMSGTSGNGVAQPSRGQSSPTGNTAAQPPGSTGQIALIPQGRELGLAPRRKENQCARLQ